MSAKSFLEKAIRDHEEPDMKMSEYHACLTGDCPHEKANDCITAIAESLKELEKDHQEDVSNYRDLLDMKNNSLNAKDKEIARLRTIIEESWSRYRRKLNELRKKLEKKIVCAMSGLDRIKKFNPSYEYTFDNARSIASETIDKITGLPS